MIKETCVWEKLHDSYSYYIAWATGCKEVHNFYKETLVESNYKFCPYCGKEIEVKKVVEDD